MHSAKIPILYPSVRGYTGLNAYLEERGGNLTESWTLCNNYTGRIEGNSRRKTLAVLTRTLAVLTAVAGALWLTSGNSGAARDCDASKDCWRANKDT